MYEKQLKLILQYKSPVNEPRAMQKREINEEEDTRQEMKRGMKCVFGAEAC